jgi:hypothetical protein
LNLILPCSGLTQLAGRTTTSFGTISACDNVERVMKKAFVLLLVGLSVAGCTQTEKGAGIGAGTGAIIGGLATGNVRGAAVGAAIGGVSGAVIGSVSEQPGQCYYRDRYGNRYVDRCPR